MRISKTLFTTATALVLCGTVAPALSQSALEEIVVTARKREETLKEIPLSISAFSSSDIERKGLQTLADIQFSAPGMQYSKQGGQVPGRFDSAIRFRGMNVNSDSPSLQLGSLFVDGIYVLGGTQSIPLDDLERIEVIKGPQSAYFGRNTFGGAINYITKTPSLTEYKGKVSVSAATYSDFDVSASHEGPIVEDKLSYRIGGRLYSKGSMWRATDGGALGEESSKSVSAVLFAAPSDRFKLKLRGFYNKDDDGPAAGGLISGFLNDSCTGKTVRTQDPAFPTARPVNYVCGIVPRQGVAISALGNTRIIDSNTSLFPQQLAIDGMPNFLIDNLVRRPNPPQLDAPSIDHMGLVRDVTRLSLSAEYELDGGYTATVQGGYNRLRASWIRDFGLTAIENWYSRDPQDAKDYSIEARISSPTDHRLQWLAGASYYHQTFIQSGSGGDALSLCTTIISAPRPGEKCTRDPFFLGNSLLQNTDRIKAWGVFGSLNYKITDQLTATFEGRYQNNKAATAILTPTPITVVDKNFLPRAILKYQPTPDTNLYASYAKGVIQGQPNAQIATATPNELRQYQAVVPGVAATLPAEILDMFELGWKQGLWDNRANFSLATYYGKWKNQKGRGAVAVREDCGSPSHGFDGGCTTGTPRGLGLPGQPATNLDGTAFLNSRDVNAPGTSKLWGVEFEGNVAITKKWDAHLNVTYARSEYTNFLFNYIVPVAGFSQMKGNSNARFPQWIGSLNSGYTDTLTERWDWFVNGDLQYFGKTFADESNLAQCSDYWLVNARVGAKREGLRLELFVKNLLNDKNWTACARWSDFDQALDLAGLVLKQGIAVSPQDKRQFGLRASVEF